jgi:hypothetical protein
MPDGDGGAEGYWGRVILGDQEQVLRECLSKIEEYATEPPIEEVDEETGRRVVVSEAPPRAAVLLHAVSGEGGWTAYSKLQAHAAWTMEGAERLAALLPEGLSDVRDALQELLDGRLPPRPEGLSRKDAERLLTEQGLSRPDVEWLLRDWNSGPDHPSAT